MASKRKPEGLRLQLDTDELRKAMARTKPVVEKASSTPTLSAVLLSTEKDRISVSAYDLEIGLTSTHEAEIVNAGSAAVPAHILRALIEAAPENVVELESLSNNRLRIRSGTLYAEIAGFDPDEVPAISVPESIRFAPIDSAALLGLIDAVRGAVSTDETRYNLCGALLSRSRLGWRMVSTDSHRMHVLEKSIDDKIAKAVDHDVLLSTKTLDVFRGVLKEEDSATGDLGFNKSVVVFRREGLEIVSRLVDAQFPDWKQVIPETSGHTVNIARRALIHAVERMGPIANRAGHSLTVHVGKNVVKLRAQSPDHGYVSDELVVEHDGADVTFGINSNYLLAALGSLDSDQVALGVEDSLSPVVVKPPDSKLQVCIVMPRGVEVAERDRDDGSEPIFEPLRDASAEHDRKRSCLEQVQKLGRDAARTARKEAGKPLDREGSAWPPRGFWAKSEADLQRSIPEDERSACRDAYWAEATKPWPKEDKPLSNGHDTEAAAHV